MGKEHPATATTYNNIAVVYWNMGKLDLALEYFQKALAIREARLGEDHPDTKKTKEALDILKKQMSQGQ